MLPLFSPHHHIPPSALRCCLTHFSSGVSRMSSTHPTETGIRELFDPLFVCTVWGIVSDGVLKSSEQVGRQSADDHGKETVLFSCLTIKMERSRRPTSSITVSLHLCRVASSGCVRPDPPTGFTRLHLWRSPELSAFGSDSYPFLPRVVRWVVGHQI